MRYYSKRLIHGILYLLLVLTSVSVLFSCRSLVLEDRSECPAFLFFDITNADVLDISEYAHITAYKYPDGNLLAVDTTTVRAVQDKEFYLQVKRSDSSRGYGVLRFIGAHNDGSQWTAELGEEFPPLWRFDYESPASTESYLIRVEAVKDHSVIDIHFLDADLYEGSGGEFPYYIVIRSNTCGIDGMDGSPVKGPFLFEPVEYACGRFRFTVPRQFDRSLHMEIWGRDGFPEEGNLVADLALWYILRDTNDFSWQAKNLADAEIEISLAENKYIVTVAEWAGETHSSYEN